MVTYRGRIEIIADILRVVETSAKKTQIMYRANLSFKILQKYLTNIVEESLVSYEDKTKIYVLTDKGRKFLILYKEYSKSNKYIQNRLKNVNKQKRFLEKLCITKN